jgi:2,5-diamino-6-(ribosylamino)-4(3H)-pyrimidinone 5'-phosphate reductase
MTPMNCPRILVNAAITADGKIDSSARKGSAISSAAGIARVNHLRASINAVLVGGRIILSYAPNLTMKSTKLRAERLHKG